MIWYKKLTIDQKITMKEYFILLCGVDFALVGKIFTLRERIEIFHNKLILEGIIE